MDILLSFLGGPNTLIGGLLALIVAVGAAFFKGRSTARKEAIAERLAGQVKSQKEQLEMHREADRIERENIALADAKAREKAKRVVG